MHPLHVGELAVRHILMLDNEQSGRSTAELNGLIHSIWSETTDAAIENALHRDLAAIELRSTFRLVKAEKVP